MIVSFFIVYVELGEGKGNEGWSKPVMTKNWNTSKFYFNKEKV